MSADDQAFAEPFRRIQPEEARSLIDSGQVTVVDVREPWEYEKDHIAGSKLIPLARIISNPAQITPITWSSSARSVSAAAWRPKWRRRSATRTCTTSKAG